MSDEREYSIDDVETVLRKSSKVKLGWYQKLDIVGHTGLVLIFDKVKKFTVDYGTSDGAAFPDKAIGGKRGGVHIYDYKQIYRFKYVLCQIEKSRVIEFLQQCLAHAADSYNLLTNNCRDFVAKIGKELFDKKSLVEKKYHRLIASLKDIEENDELKLAVGVGVGVGVIAGALIALSALIWGSPDSDDEEN